MCEKIGQALNIPVLLYVNMYVGKYMGTAWKEIYQTQSSGYFGDGELRHTKGFHFTAISCLPSKNIIMFICVTDDKHKLFLISRRVHKIDFFIFGCGAGYGNQSLMHARPGCSPKPP